MDCPLCGFLGEMQTNVYLGWWVNELVVAPSLVAHPSLGDDLKNPRGPPQGEQSCLQQSILVSPVCSGNSLSENCDLNFLLSLKYSVVLRKFLGASELPLLWILHLVSTVVEKMNRVLCFNLGGDCYMYHVMSEDVEDYKKQVFFINRSLQISIVF